MKTFTYFILKRMYSNKGIIGVLLVGDPSNHALIYCYLLNTQNLLYII